MKKIHSLMLLVALVMFSTVFTSCEKDDENDTKTTAIKFTNSSSVNFKINEAKTFTINVDVKNASGATKMEMKGNLPAGLTFTDNANGSAKIAGTATAAGTATVTINATNNNVTATQEIVVTASETSVEPTGDSTEANPYTVTQAITKQGAKAWVKGYIVGQVNGMKVKEDAEFDNFTAPKDDNGNDLTQSTNILIAASATETNVDNCLVIQLPSGAIRGALNLIEHADNKGKEVVLYGSLENYFGVPGLKGAEFAKLDGAEYGVRPVDVTGAILNATFATDMSGFTANSAVGVQAWTVDTKYKCIKISGFDNATKKNIANEDWLISPAMDLSSVASATLTFQQAGKIFGAPKENFKVLVSTDYTDDVATATWTELVVPKNSEWIGDSWSWFNSGDVVLTVGSATTTIAFKYISTTEKSGTWELKNVVVK